MHGAFFAHHRRKIRHDMVLPNFLIIGAAKAGTTSLYHYLRQHPEVYMSPVKEPRYYWYEGLAEGRLEIVSRIAYERLFRDVTSQRAVGEATTHYLNSPTAPDRIAADLPGVRLVVSLRNPADRAYSSYLGRLQGGEERRGVEEAMRPGSYYFESSLYHPNLSRYFERFARNRIKVLLFDDLVANPRAVVQDLYEFLGVAPTFDVDVTTLHNRAAVPRSLVANRILVKTGQIIHGLLPLSMRNTGVTGQIQRLLLRRPEPLPPAIRRQLLEQFRDDICKTAALIGRPLSHWLE
jgi:hypothetical protein